MVVLEELGDFSLLVEREQFWIDAVRPEYNIRKTAHNNKPSITELTILAHKRRAEKMRGRKASPETKKKMSDFRKKFYSNPANHKPISEERKKHLSEINTGERNPNWGTKRPKEFGDMISNLFSSVEYTYISPSGKEVVFRNLTKFCKDNDLSYIAMRSMHQGKRKSPYKGWTFKSKTFVGYKKERQGDKK